MIDEFVKPVNPLPGTEPVTLVSPRTTPQPFENGKPAEDQLSKTPRIEHMKILPEIDNTNRNFKGQQKHEVVLCFCRKHWIVLLPHFIGFFIFGLAWLAFALFADKAVINEFMGQSTYQILALTALAGLTFYVHAFFLRIFNYYIQTMIITNFRVIHLEQTLFFTRNRDSIDIREIQDIVIQQKGILKTLLNYGEIIITLSSAHATKMLYYVPNPEYHFSKINKTKREYISKRQDEKAK